MSVVAFHGKHVIIDLYGCKDEYKLDAPILIRDIMMDIAIKNGATIVGTVEHRFKPNGVSVVVVIGESHISVHSWYESKEVMLDVCTCGKVDAEKIADELIEWFDPNDIRKEVITRGRGK